MGVTVLYLGMTVIGYFTGAIMRKNDRDMGFAGKVPVFIITILVFIMGSRIGSDETIVRSLDTIGLTALGLTLFMMAGSVAAVFALRKVMGFDKEGRRKISADMTGGPGMYTSSEQNENIPADPGADTAACEEKGQEPEREMVRTDHTMTVCIVTSVAAGIAAGYLILPDSFIEITGSIIVVGLCLLLFFVGVDIGLEGTIIRSFREAGWRIVIFPFAVIAGTFIGAAAASLVLPVGLRDSLCVGAGFGWYTLAPAMLADYSLKVSALSFMHNVMREMIAILIIPTVAKKVGYIECTSLPGAAAMDICLPIVEGATRGDIAVYSFVTGAVLSAAVPVMVSFLAGI